jgi:hypothetical protein
MIVRPRTPEDLDACIAVARAVHARGEWSRRTGDGRRLGSVAFTPPELDAMEEIVLVAPGP